jgi:hypothetical protein
MRRCTESLCTQMYHSILLCITVVCIDARLDLGLLAHSAGQLAFQNIFELHSEALHLLHSCVMTALSEF